MADYYVYLAYSLLNATIPKLDDERLKTKFNIYCNYYDSVESRLKEIEKTCISQIVNQEK